MLFAFVSLHSPERIGVGWIFKAVFSTSKENAPGNETELTVGTSFDMIHRQYWKLLPLELIEVRFGRSDHHPIHLLTK